MKEYNYILSRRSAIAETRDERYIAYKGQNVLAVLVSPKNASKYIIVPGRVVKDYTKDNKRISDCVEPIPESEQQELGAIVQQVFVTKCCINFWNHEGSRNL